MDYTRFLSMLARTPRHWTVEFYGAIRTEGKPGETACPISSLMDLKAAEVQSAAHRLGIDTRVLDVVVAAADNKPGHDPALRADLLSACGLTRRQ